MTVGKRLKYLREHKNLSMREFAALIKTHKKNVYWWEIGKFVPGASSLVRIAEFYGVSVDWILHGIAAEGNEFEQTLDNMSKMGDTMHILAKFKTLTPDQQQQAIAYLEKTVGTVEK